jgi:transcriptional regulator with XRE-family HTH domain
MPSTDQPLQQRPSTILRIQTALEENPGATLAQLCSKTGLSKPTIQTYYRNLNATDLPPEQLLPEITPVVNQDASGEAYLPKCEEETKAPSVPPNPAISLDKSIENPTVYTEVYIMAYLKGFDQGFKTGFEKGTSQPL